MSTSTSASAVISSVFYDLSLNSSEIGGKKGDNKVNVNTVIYKRGEGPIGNNDY